MSFEELGGKMFKALKDFKDLRGKLERELDEATRRIEALDLEEQSVLGDPVARAELIAALCARITFMAQIGRGRINETLSLRVDRPRAHGYPSAVTPDVISWKRISDAIAGRDNLGLAANALISAAWPNDAQGELTFDGIAIATLFEEPLKAGLTRCLEAVPWPYPEPALSLEQRRKRLADIEVERAGLQQRKAELVELIADAMTG